MCTMHMHSVLHTVRSEAEAQYMFYYKQKIKPSMKAYHEGTTTEQVLYPAELAPTKIPDKILAISSSSSCSVLDMKKIR